MHLGLVNMLHKWVTAYYTFAPVYYITRGCIWRVNFAEEFEAIKDNTSGPNCNQIPVPYSLFTCFRIQLLVQYSVPYIVCFQCLKLQLKGRSSFTLNMNTYGIEHIKLKHFYICRVTTNVNPRKNVLNSSFNHRSGKLVLRSVYEAVFIFYFQPLKINTVKCLNTINEFL